MIIVVSGGAGQLGRRTADQLLERVGPSSLVLVTRDPSSLADYAARGVTVREGDFDHPDSLPAAFAGIDGLLLDQRIGSRSPRAGSTSPRSKPPRRRASATSSTRRSSTPVRDNPSVAAQEHYATEQALRASGLRWTMLRNSIYADIQTRFLLEALSSGQYLPQLR